MISLYFASQALKNPDSPGAKKHADELQTLFGESVPRISRVASIMIDKGTGQALCETAVLEDGRALFIFFSRDGAPTTIVEDNALALLVEVWGATVDERNIELADNELAAAFEPLLKLFYETWNFCKHD